MPTELDENAFGLFLVIDVEHVLEGERLEIKFVARIIVGGNRFGVGIHHNGFKSELAQSEGRMHTAVVEFDTLADPVRPAAKNDYFTFAAVAPLVFVTVG